MCASRKTSGYARPVGSHGFVVVRVLGKGLVMEELQEEHVREVDTLNSVSCHLVCVCVCVCVCVKEAKTKRESVRFDCYHFCLGG